MSYATYVARWLEQEVRRHEREFSHLTLDVPGELRACSDLLRGEHDGIADELEYLADEDDEDYVREVMRDVAHRLLEPALQEVSS